jgi:predicted HD superfamily hydrolase involved in NAD metabolism
MDLELIRKDLKNLLKKSRYLHSIGVEEVAHDLALLNGYDTNKAVLAGLLHDCAKYLTEEELLNTCQTNHIPVTDIEKRCAFLLHAKVGALFAKEKYGIEDQEILNAISYHTTGRPNMTLPEKIIFIADYIEPYRRPLPRIDEIRRASYEDLNFGVFLVCENVLSYLKSTAGEIDPLTEETYKYYKDLLQERT